MTWKRAAGIARRGTGNETDARQMFEDMFVFSGRYLAVAVTVRDGRTRVCGGKGIIARVIPKTVLVGVDGRPQFIRGLVHSLDLGVLDHLLPFKDTADQEANDYHHDGDLHQGETGFALHFFC